MQALLQILARSLTRRRTVLPTLAGLGLCLLAVPGGTQGLKAQEKGPPQLVDDREAMQIRAILRAGNYGDHAGQLHSLGAAVQKGDRTEFLHIALKLTSHAEAGVRYRAVDLIAEIGTSEHASTLAPLLADDRAEVQYSAAAALARIGTQKEVEAFDRRLAIKHPEDEPDLIATLKRSRDLLRKRLEAAKSKK